MKDELVSIIIPVYKIEDFIENILDAILNQTYKNLELILVDDGSEDKSIEVAESFLQGSSQKYRIIHQENKGLSGARNTGIRFATGNWVICPDGDDYIDRTTIERLMGAVKENNSDVAFCRFKSVNLEKIKQQHTWDNGDYLLSHLEMKKNFLSRRLPIIVPGTLMRKSIAESLWFDENCPYAEDIHFIWRLLFICNNAVYVDCDLYNYLKRGNSIISSLTPDKYINSIKEHAKMADGLLRNHPDEKALIKMIQPKFVLASSHVLAKSNNYKEFKKAVISVGYKKGMRNLIKINDLRLCCYALIFCISLYLFYKISVKY